MRCWLVLLLMNGAAFSTRHGCGRRGWHSRFLGECVSLFTICMDLFAHGQASTQRANMALQAICLGGMLPLTAAGLYGMSPNTLHMQLGRRWAGQCAEREEHASEISCMHFTCWSTVAARALSWLAMYVS